MLGTRTKQIYSYGKRKQRVVNVSENNERKLFWNVFDDVESVPLAPLASRMKKRAHPAQSKSRTPALSPKVVHMNRKKRLSPVLTPPQKRNRVPQLIDAEPRKREVSSKQTSPGTPSRAPLASVSLNTPGSSALVGKNRKAKITGAKGTPLKLNRPRSTFLNVDIITLDNTGKTVGQERRVSRTDIQTNTINEGISKPLERLSSHRKPTGHPVNEAEDDEVIEHLRQPKRPFKRTVTTIYSDDSESENEIESVYQSPNMSTLVRSSKAGPSRLVVEVLIPPAPYRIKKIVELDKVPSPLPGGTPPSPDPVSESPSPVSEHPPFPVPEPPLPQLVSLRPYQHISSPVPKARQLTPIRRNGSRSIYNLPLPPSPSLTSTDLDLSFDFEGLDISKPSELDGSHFPKHEIPDSLEPLLEECGQLACGPIEFSSFIDTFPYDPVVQSEGKLSADLRFRKIGEASYSEVFGIGEVVLKVVPLRDESGGNVPTGQAGAGHRNGGDILEDSPAPTDAKDVLKEIIVTHAMGEVCDGFVKLLKAYVVRGKYPEVLLRLWDEYHANKGSESIRPDKFLVSQVYTIIVLPNGGPDLEAYKFINASRMGWKQACSVFWQVAKSLAHAEQLVSFEHRDLHMGQILVKDLPMQPETQPLQARNQNASLKSTKAFRVHMDDPVHGVRTTLIDLGLSRMDAGDGQGGEMVHWTPFEAEVFMGEGDYQFDVYRMMREHNGNTWEVFKPLTNIMWLHYLAMKLMKSKRLKPPSASRTSPTADTAAFTERDCYDCLVDIECWLRNSVTVFAPVPNQTKGKGRKKMLTPTAKLTVPSGPACAAEVVLYAAKKGWIQSIA